MLTTVDVSEGRALVVPYDFPPGAMVTVRVLAEAPVNTYLVDSDAKAEWAAGRKNFQSWGGFESRRDQVFQVRLPPRNRWFLIIDNPGRDLPVHVQYEAIVEPFATTPTGMTYMGSGSYRR